MNEKTSAGSVPGGLELYWFEYIDGICGTECFNGSTAPETCFLESPQEAIAFAQLHRASKAIHAVSGDLIYHNPVP